MNNLEICKRIAEIEGITHSVSRSMRNEFKVVTPLKGDEEPQEDYNPLTDDALCFALMVKYKVSLHYDKNDGATPYSAFNQGEYYKYHQSENPNKAILLAIIEVHKEL